nr:hypothetical protein StreXyl84_79780 [Streptomyces sp. Xyl84]
MLQEAGYPVEELAEEIEQPQARAFGQAARLADAADGNSVVREYLGLPDADPVQQAPLVQPGQPAQVPAGKHAESGLRHGTDKCGDSVPKL